MRVSVGMSDVVLKIGSGLTLRRAAELMTAKGIGAAIVENEEWPIPRIITERDILTAVGTGLDPDVEVVADHMSEKVITASPEWSLERAAMEMTRRKIRHLAIYREGNLIGVLSMRDILRVWAEDGATSGGPP